MENPFSKQLNHAKMPDSALTINSAIITTQPLEHIPEIQEVTIPNISLNSNIQVNPAPANIMSNPTNYI